MNALRGCTDKLPGWARGVTVGLLFVLAAALFAQNHPANKNNNPPPKGQPAGHAPQASGHAASGPNTHSGGSASGPNTHSGGGGRQIQANRSVDRPTTTNSVRPGGSRPVSYTHLDVYKRQGSTSTGADVLSIA